MSVTNITELLAMRRRWEDRQRAVRHYQGVLVEDLSVGQLVHRLRGTGLTLSNRHGVLVLHESNEPPTAA